MALISFSWRDECGRLHLELEHFLDPVQRTSVLAGQDKGWAIRILCGVGPSDRLVVHIPTDIHILTSSFLLGISGMNDEVVFLGLPEVARRANGQLRQLRSMRVVARVPEILAEPEEQPWTKRWLLNILGHMKHPGVRP